MDITLDIHKALDMHAERHPRKMLTTVLYHKNEVK